VAVLAVGAGAWHAWHSGINHGALVGLSVVLVACPCSLGLATPLAIWAGLGLAARHQVLFRDSEALERLATIRAIRFDKTGTLTTGLAHVEEFISDPGSPPAEVLARGAALAGSSTHPFSRAIREFATGCQCIGNSANGSVHEDPRCIDVRLVAGRGVSGRFPHKSSETLFLGNQWWMVESGLQLSDVLTRVVDVAIASGRSLSLVGWDGRVKGAFVLSERLRPSAAQALRWCRDKGLDVGIVTGDHGGRAWDLAAQLGVPVLAEQLPEDKVAAIRATRIRFGPVAMVGDGVNDAPALAASDVGIALGCGADVSRDSADVCLLSDDPAVLPWAIAFARRSVRTIRRNLFWAFAYNGVGIALACAGWLNPAVSAFLMVASSLLVINHALRLAVDVDGPEFATHAEDAEPTRVPTLSVPVATLDSRFASAAGAFPP
jgi:cation transport ATPase